MTTLPTATGSDAATPSALLRTLRPYAHDRAWFAGRLLGVARAPERVGEVAARSYRHPNGFAKLVLGPLVGGWLRLHVYPAGDARLGDGNPHGHRWSFASVVLVGAGLEHTFYVEGGDATAEARDRYAYVAGDDLTFETTTRLTVTGRVVVGRGDPCGLVGRAVHAVRPLGDDLVATLVLQGPTTRPTAEVYRPVGATAGPAGVPLDAAEVRDLLELVVAGCAS